MIKADETTKELEKEQEQSTEEESEDLQDSIRELRTSYDGLLKRFEDYILNEIIGKQLSFEKYKRNLQNRYRK